MVKMALRSATAAAIILLASGPAAAQQAPDFGSLFRNLNPAGQQQQQQPQTPAEPGVQLREWAGYAQRFQTLRPSLDSGDFAAARTMFQTVPAAEAQQPAADDDDDGEANNRNRRRARTPRSMADRAGAFLGNAELGMMQFDTGDYASARTTFATVGQAAGTDAQAQGERRSILSRVRDGASAATRMIGGALGNEELGPYRAPEYERVLQLNFLALSYLMAGDAAAFNVTLRQGERERDNFDSLADQAGRLQDEARVAFEAERAEAERRLAEARGDATQGQDAASVEQQMAAVYETEDFCQAPNVPSAFVNPLGFYISGVVYEVSGVQFREDIESARIAYEKALLLAPRSAVLQGAVRELNGTATPRGRLVHAIVAEGFAPTRQVVRSNLQINTDILPINVPRLTCHPSNVARIELRSPRGQVLGRLDPIADVEGMMLQRQQQREGITTLSVIVNAVRGGLENRWGQQNAFANMFVQLKQQNFDRPDMRSWSTLPARVHVARTYVPDSLTELNVVSLDARGRVIATRTMALDTTSRQNVLYARAAGQTIVAGEPAQLWIAGQ